MQAAPFEGQLSVTVDCLISSPQACERHHPRTRAVRTLLSTVHQARCPLISRRNLFRFVENQLKPSRPISALAEKKTTVHAAALSASTSRTYVRLDLTSEPRRRRFHTLAVLPLADTTPPDNGGRAVLERGTLERQVGLAQASAADSAASE